MIKQANEEKIVAEDYFFDMSGKSPRYYQRVTINRTVEAIAKGQDRILLVMATEERANAINAFKLRASGTLNKYIRALLRLIRI